RRCKGEDDREQPARRGARCRVEHPAERAKARMKRRRLQYLAPEEKAEQHEGDVLPVMHAVVSECEVVEGRNVPEGEVDVEEEPGHNRGDNQTGGVAQPGERRALYESAGGPTADTARRRGPVGNSGLPQD